MIEIGVPRPPPTFRERAQFRRRIKSRKDVARIRVRIRHEQQPAILGDEQKDEPIHQPQQLAIIILGFEFPRVQFVAQIAIGWVREKAAPQRADRIFDAATQLIERARPLLCRRPRPFFEPAIGGIGELRVGSRQWGVGSRFPYSRLPIPYSQLLHSRLMTHEPEQDKIGIDLPIHHRLQIKLDERLSREHLVIAQNAQPQSVRHERPQMRVRAIQQNLHQPVRTVARRARHTLGARIEVNVTTDEVYRRILPPVRNRIRIARDLNRLRRRESSVTQFLKQRQEPAFARQRRTWVGVRQFRRRIAERRPRAQRAIPRAIDRLVDLLALGKMIRFRRHASRFKPCVAIGDALKQIRRQYRAFYSDGGEGDAGIVHIFKCLLVEMG